jgi:hypothetical protein
MSLYFQGDTQCGPVDTAQMCHLIVHGVVTPRSMVWMNPNEPRN